jgi:chromosome segregation ATPase
VSGLNESARQAVAVVRQRDGAVTQRNAAVTELNKAKQSIVDLTEKASTAVSERDAAVKQLKSAASECDTASTRGIWQRCKRCAECATSASVAAEKERADTLQQQLTDATADNEQHVTAIATLNCTVTEQAATIASLTVTVTAVAATAAKWRMLSRQFAALALSCSAYADTLNVPYTQWQQFAISCVVALLLYVLMRKCCAIGIGQGAEEHKCSVTLS